MPLIILEGCDGAGKSTLAQSLETLGHQSQRQVQMIHKGPPTGTWSEEYVAPLGMYMPSVLCETLIICDRWAVGEEIYGPKYRGVSIVDQYAAVEIDHFLDKKGALKIILDAPNDELRRRAFETRGEDFLKESDLEEVAQWYRNYAAAHSDWQITTSPNPQVILQTADTLEVMAAHARAHR